VDQKVRAARAGWRACRYREVFLQFRRGGRRIRRVLAIGTLHGEKNFVDVAETVLAAAESGFDVLGDGELQKTSSMGLSSRASRQREGP